MIDWLTYAGIGIGLVVGLLCVVLGFAGKRPSDLSLGATVLVELYLVVQIVVSIIAPLTGNTPTGSVLEYWVYLISAALLPPLAAGWALLERNSRWSTVILGVVSLAIVVMVYRMDQIWNVQIA